MATRSPKQSSKAAAKRPDGLTILAWAHAVSGVYGIFAGLGAAIFLNALRDNFSPFQEMAGTASVLLLVISVVGVAQLWVARSLYRMEAAAYVPAIALSVVLLFASALGPISMALGIATIVYLFQGHVKPLFGR